MKSKLSLLFVLLAHAAGEAEAAVPRVLVAPIESQAGLADLAWPIRQQLCEHLNAYEGATLVTSDPHFVVRAKLSTDGEEIDLEVRLASSPDGTEVHRFLVEDDDRDAKKLAAGAAAGLSAYWLDHPMAPATKPSVARTPTVRDVDPVVPVVAPPVRTSAKVTAAASSPEVAVATANPLAAWMFWGGVVAAAAGAGLGAVGHFGYDAPLTDGTKRRAADNQALLDGGQAFAVAGDIAVVSGGVIAAAGVVLWIAGIGASPVETAEVVQ